MSTIGKIIVMVVLSLALVACEKSAQDTTSKWLMPEGLNDCKVYYLQNTGGNSITVMRCPNSETTTQSGGKSKINVNIK